METDLILGLAIAGATLGIVEGIKPGPLLTMVIRETLSGGLRAGLWTAAAPIFTDGPLVIFSLFAAAWIATNPSVLLAITLAGAIFLAQMGYECFGLDPPNMDEDAPPSNRLISQRRNHEFIEPKCVCFLVSNRRPIDGLSS
ncbi:MAG: LysE family translocator [Candidatus Thalassarchaeaceae archaeon]